MIIPNNHISLVSEDQIRDICKPLFVSTGINYFIFARFYDDGSHMALPSNADWHAYFWQQGYQKSSPVRLVPGCHLWHAEHALSKASQEAKNFNIDNKFEIVERREDYYDVFGFGSETGNRKVIDYYLNNRAYLKKFSFYFKEKANSLIKHSEHPSNRLMIHELINRDQNFPANNMNKHLNMRLVRFPSFALSSKELQCLLLTLRGRTASESSSILNISSKTVESYLGQVKKKLNCHRRSALFDKAYEMGLFDLF